MGSLVSWITGNSSWASSSSASSASSSSSSSTDSLGTHGPSERLVLPPSMSPADPSPDDSSMPDTPMVSRNHAFVSSYFEPAVSGTPSASSSPSVEVDILTNEAFPSREIDMRDTSDPHFGATTADLCFEDDGLSVLEKIYLFSVSNASFHK